MTGMKTKGIAEEAREEIYTKLEAFAEFGFPESHSFSFAYLVYASAWLKVHYPENFYAGILAAQPMGFYSPQTLVSDARRHGVEILPIDVCRSEENSCVELTPRREVSRHPLVSADPCRGLRLGLSNIQGLKGTINRILDARAEKQFESVADLGLRAKLTTAELEKLASAGALESLGMSRREGIWAAQALSYSGRKVGPWFQPALPGMHVGATAPRLPHMSAAEENVTELRTTGISVSTHPMDFLRPELAAGGILTVETLTTYPAGKRVRVAGIVTHRQRPHTASGTTFLSLEDETGLLNVICSVGLWERYRKILRTSSGLIVRGVVERADDVMNFVADGVSALELSMPLPSRDFK